MTPPTTMARTARAKTPLSKRHLARLSKIAAEDHETLYARRPAYRGRLIAVTLAQGAALHYLDRKNGVKDLDVWSFFALPPGESRFPEDKRTKHVDFGPSDLGRQRYDLTQAPTPRKRAQWVRWTDEHQGRRVDLMMRGLGCEPGADPADAIRQWLLQGKPTSSPGLLRRQAVILIDPADRRGEVVWRPDDVHSIG
ncbi:hypothetical protein GCM10009641_46920 [Mycobacterium cookii]|uniref:Uncharacterized protein n=1 Tax=Nocardioides furvisabuli TaxID=375542 RepID=A0ABN2XSQ0_9ACTN|nr:hypothetical protein [Nocardioides furvisabuli]